MGNVALILEYEAGCNREQHLSAAGMDIAQAGVFVDALAALAEPVDSHFIWRPQLKEPSDEMVLEAAVNGRAQAIVTFKRRDFGTVPERFGFRVLLPRDAFKKGLRVTDTSTYPLRLPKSVKAAAEKLAREEGVNMNQFVATAAAEKLAAMQAATFIGERRQRAALTAFRKLLKRTGCEPPREGDERPA